MATIPPTSGIYQIVCLPTSKFYIGSAVNLQKRWWKHQSLLNHREKILHHNQHLQSAWDKYGAANFEFRILEFVEADRLLEREQYYLDTLRPTDPAIGYNIAPTAGSILGLTRSEDFRAQVSERQKRLLSDPERLAAFKIINVGRVPSPEQREKQRAYMLNNPLTPEQKQAKYGNRKPPVFTPEGLARIDAARRLKVLSPEQKAALIASNARSYIVTAPDGTIYQVKNMNAFCREHGLQPSAMCMVAQGKAVQHHGWTCRYADTKESG